MISMTVLVTVLLITPGLSMNVQVLVESRTRLLDFIPLFWFLGIYEVLNPEGTLIPSSQIWAKTAVEAMFVVAVLFVVTYLVSYRRYSKKILEGVESNVFAQSWLQRLVAWGLNATILRHPLQRASFYFIGRIFGRSSRHRLLLAMYSGIGLALTVSSLFTLRKDTNFVLSISPYGLMEAPLILSFFVVSGLRAIFNMPYELNANWMFQMATGTDAAEFLKATRKWVLLRGLLPVYVVLAPFQFAFFDPAQATFHLLFALAVGAILTEGFFFKFNKVPFTCSYLPAKSHLVFLGGAYLYGFTIYTVTMAQLEMWVIASPSRTFGFFTAVVVAMSGVALYRRRIVDLTLRIVYEDDADPVVRQLNLT
jgi:hypothetical protein